jgi:hypothetical protein
MTGVKFIGRLGNQLFQYHFLMYLKSRNQGRLFFFPNPHHAYLTRYFDLGWYHNLTLGSKLYSLLMRSIPRLLDFREIQVHNFVSPRDISPENWCIYNGYFQSDYYLNKIDIPVKIRIRPQYVEQFRALYGDLFDQHKVVVVHIRRTDYLSYGKRDISLPMSYFKRELYNIPDLEQYQVVLVSDDIAFVKRAFGNNPEYLFVSNSEIIDFQLISHADIAIISNSTFSWWAAYLSTRNKRVIAPENWLGFRIGREHPKGIMTSRFEWVKVF